MISFEIGPFSEVTQIGIVAKRSGLDQVTATRIVRVVNHLSRRTDDPRTLSLRAAILIARVVALRPAKTPLTDPFLAQVIVDVLRGRGPRLCVAEVMAQFATGAQTVEEAS